MRGGWRPHRIGVRCRSRLAPARRPGAPSCSPAAGTSASPSLRPGDPRRSTAPPAGAGRARRFSRRIRGVWRASRWPEVEETARRVVAPQLPPSLTTMSPTVAMKPNSGTKAIGPRSAASTTTRRRGARRGCGQMARNRRGQTCSADARDDTATPTCRVTGPCQLVCASTGAAQRLPAPNHARDAAGGTSGAERRRKYR